LVLTAAKVPVALSVRDTVYPVGLPAGIPQATVILPFVLFAVAVTPVGTLGGTQTGLAETSAEFGELQMLLLAVTM
jgi:hypothetical protein